MPVAQCDPGALPSLDLTARELLRPVLRPGDLAVDATAGNGHDTEFLARMVRKDGQVLAFDVQQEALDRTGERLKGAGLFSRVRLIRDGHERVQAYLEGSGEGRRVRAAMFNLGWLPGSDKRCITRPPSTLQALTALTACLEPGGLVTVHAYAGHEGGREEAEAVLAWSAALPWAAWQVRCISQPNKTRHPESLIVMQRRSVDPVRHE